MILDNYWYKTLYIEQIYTKCSLIYNGVHFPFDKFGFGLGRQDKYVHIIYIL